MTERVLTFALAAWLIILVPGPSVLFTISRAMTGGRRVALSSVVGNALGEFVQVGLIAAGLGTVVSRSIVVYDAVKYVGAAYLVYLGLRALLRPGSGHVDLETPVTRGTFQALREGLMVGVSNPKTLVFLMAILPQFIDRSAGSVPTQILLLGLVFAVIALISDSLYAVAAGAARDWFTRSPRRLQRVRRTGGAIMVGLGLAVAVSGRPD